MKNILSVTGCRSDYDLMHPVYQAIHQHPALSLSLVVTGAHLSKQFGYTVQAIEEDGFHVAERIEALIDGDRDTSRLKSAAVQLMGLTQTVDRIRPDLLLILGDREETITTAICGTYLNIPIAHISGGDRTIGNADDAIRHAVTKMAHIHFATSEDSKKRILKMGEQPSRVHFSGNPGIDRIASVKSLDKTTVFRHFNFDDNLINKPLLIVIQHVMSTETDAAYSQMKETLEAVKTLNLPTVLVYPNSDAGCRDIIRCINEYKEMPNLRIAKHIPREIFINLLRFASCLIGNSSMGLLEAPFLKLPVVNIGNRQNQRFHADNVMFVEHDTQEIIEATKKACTDSEYREYVKTLPCPFGEGSAAEYIAKTLAEVTLDTHFRIKEICY
ncbi:MAG: UDP-N-acetyl glucosamine 2-epimerase [marine bacterium B5-7]|nr:MAG: UDP-N-acetyl glucosamine 2-epimerase [marine bacterium B5-7]